MDTEQMSGSTFAFPAALTWVTDSTNRSYKIDTRPLCLGHIKMSVLRNSAKMVSKNIICADEQKSLVSRKQKELKNHNPTN